MTETQQDQPRPVRDKTAQEVASELGLKRRVIELHAQEDPSLATREKRPGKRNQLWFNTEEVREWRRRRGLEADRHELFNVGERRTEDSRPRALETYRPDLTDDQVIVGLRRSLAAWILRLAEEERKGDLEPAAIQQIAASIKNIETTLSKREDAAREALEREGRLIDRTRVASVLVGLAVIFRDGGRTLAPELPARIRERLAEAAPDLAIPAELFDRVAGVVIGDAVAEMQDRVAEAVARAAAKLDVKSPAAAGKERAA